MGNRSLVATEHEEQKTLFQWAEIESSNHPELNLMYAIPNGARTSMSVAKRLKAEGLKAGVPDICLPVPRGKYHGLYIEMKRIGGTPSGEQREWIKALTLNGYSAYICYGWDAAVRVITEYLGMGQ